MRDAAGKWVGMGAHWAGAILLLALVLGGSARAQGALLQIKQLDRLAEKAADTVEVNLDKKLLQLAARFLDPNKPQEARVRELVGGLDGVYVRVFEFNKPGEYSSADVEGLRAQLQGWSKIVGVRSRREGQNVDVHIKYEGERVLGLAIIAANPRELTVVNIVGPIDLEKLSQLQGQFGIPSLDLEKATKPTPRKD
ncbi:MAG: DUF4252 domain-containing protein [Blastocatellia bacterium]|nr:DUF4252 domain-containing protein [Blastocatellia bacterium]